VRRLVLHLGLPKTATTSLQTHVFSRMPGYAGKFNQGDLFPSPRLQELRDAFIHRALVSKGQVSEVAGRESWIPALQSWVEELLATDEPIVFLSDEGLSWWRSPVGDSAEWPVIESAGAVPRRGPHPFISLVQTLRRLLPSEVELKTVLVLRNQSDWLASLAAQEGVLGTAFVHRLIRDNDAFLDYYAIVEDLRQSCGPDNHLTLLFENSFEGNAEAILRFAGYSLSESTTPVVSRERENARRSDKGWFVGAVQPHDRLELVLRKWSDRSPWLARFLSSENSPLGLIRPLVGYEARQRASTWLFNKRAATISLTEDQKTAIRIHCRASNARLSRHLGVDLDALGY
jgi:hypothetical protein